MARNHALRMGKRTAFESLDGAQHANSFWCLGQIGIDIDDQALRLHFIGFHDAAAYDAGKAPVAGAEKRYLITGDGFQSSAAMLTAAANIPISAEILRLAWVAATETLDTDDPDHAGQKISFFAGAVDV